MKLLCNIVNVLAMVMALLLGAVSVHAEEFGHGQIKLLAPIADNPSPRDMKVVRTAAEMIAMHAGSAMTDLFPEDSLEAPSEARSEIWQRWQEFTGYAGKLEELGQELGLTAEVTAMPREVTEAAAPILSPLPKRNSANGKAWILRG